MAGEIDENLASLNSEALYRLAEWHDKQATICRAQAHRHQIRRDQAAKIQGHEDYLAASPKVVARYLKQGHDIDRAKALAAEHSGIPLVTISARWDKFAASREKKAVQQRNALAYEMHCLGVSNVSIASRLNLHPVTVSKVIAAERKKRLYQHNAERLALYPASRAVAEKSQSAKMNLYNVNKTRGF